VRAFANLFVTKRSECPSSISLQHGGKMEKKNKEVRFYAQIHSSRVNKHVRNSRLTVDSKHIPWRHSKIFTQLFSYRRANVIARHKGSRGDETSMECRNSYLYTATFCFCRRSADRTLRVLVTYSILQDLITMIWLIMLPVLVNDMF